MTTFVNEITEAQNSIRSKSSIVTQEIVRETEYSSQYYKTYCVRLDCLTEVIEAQLKNSQMKDLIIRRLSDLVPGESCIIIGTLYKHMENKPSVIKELTDAHQLGLRPEPPKKLTSPNDQLFLEDSQQRIKLAEGTIDTPQFVTGIVVALIGHESETVKGLFIVEDIVHATPLNTIIKNPTIMPESRYIAIISGIGLENKHGVSVTLKLTLDWMCGSLLIGSIPIDPRTIGRLIIAGNSLEGCCRDKIALQSKFVIKKSSMDSDLPMEVLDSLLNNACPSIPIDIMPGPNDPTSIVLPQKPLHKVMFPKASQWTTFNCRSNPWMFDLDNGSFVVGTSGQNIDDIDRYSEINEPIDRLRATVTWGHLAPTAPDTLPAYPNASGKDPLVLPSKPYLYFAGNQDVFQWKKDENEEGINMLVTVPKFKSSGAVVLVDVHKNSCMCINFQ